MKTNTFTKVLMLNISQDMAWASFALYMFIYFDVPLYIVMLPILANIGIFLYGARMVMNDNTLNPRDTRNELNNNKSASDVDEMLATIARENLGESVYGNTHTVGSNIVYNNND
jgi:hypothetical protein